MEVNDKIDLSIYTLCIHDIPNFSLIFQYFWITAYKVFSKCCKSPLKKPMSI